METFDLLTIGVFRAIIKVKDIMSKSVSLDEIFASLDQRGFLDDGLEAVQTQVFAVSEELAEVARMMRRHRQGVNNIDYRKLMDEAADVVIAAVCLLWAASQGEANRIVRSKLQADELRGYRHSGKPLKDTSITAKTGEASTFQRNSAGELEKAVKQLLEAEKQIMLAENLRTVAHQKVEARLNS